MSKDAVLTLFEEMKKRAFGISDRSPDPEDGFVFSLMPVGLPIRYEDFRDPWAPGSTTTGGPAALKQRQQSLFNLSVLLNAKLQMDGSGRVMQGAGTISDSWKTIIGSASRMKNPLAPSPENEQRVANAQALLWRAKNGDVSVPEKTPLYKAYEEAELAWRQAEADYAHAFQEASKNVEDLDNWPVTGKLWLARVDQARETFDSYAKDVKPALATIAAQGRDAVESIIALANANFDPWQLALNQIAKTAAYVQVFPSNWADPAATEGWTKLTFSQKDTRTDHDESTTNWGAKGGISFGFWRASAGVNSTTVRESDDSSEDGLEVELSYAVARIERPWLTTILLSVDGWAVLGADAGAISDGTATQQKDKNLAWWLPALPTQMLLVKNVKIRTSTTKKTFDKIQEHVTKGGSFGWGPFSIGGKHTRDSLSTEATSHIEDGAIVIDGVQLVGWVSEVMPYTPPQSGL